ncbi:MAG: uroporphyrinogen decarboxylase [Deltaproteobacteria bacterium]|nr:uroporphyrinogen decarboxylase [Deltaproteobacteria bacterium]
MPPEPAAPRFLAACRREPVDRPPVWMMRQAGRYLPEYREVRGQVGFLELCKTPDLACEVTCQPIRRFGFDAAILFSDILIPVEAMGMPVEFVEDLGPVLDAPIRLRGDLDRLRVPDPEATMPFVPEAVRRIRRALPATPLIGFSGAPLTLAAYMIEGAGSKDFVELKRFLWADPEAARRLLRLVTDTVVLYLEAQVAAGAQAVQLFDTWAGVLAPRDYDELVLPYVTEIVARLRPRGVPIIYFVNGAAPLLERMKRTGADVMGLDWRVDLGEARARLGPDVAVQGNLDPVALHAPPAVIAERTRAVLAAGGGTGHVFNLGHGILPDTPIAGVEAMLAAIRGEASGGAG